MSPATAAVPADGERLPQKTSRAFEVAFAPERRRVRHMRRMTTEFLRREGVFGEPAESIVLIVSELVTNAVEHGKGPGKLHVRHLDDEVRVEVTDNNAAPAEIHPAGPEDESGRGLALTEVLAETWGVSEDCRTTWARFAVPTGRPR
ncbi:ATP-binding protein [Streptomyces sp. NPDC050095]|uniref:ATP-binding protein n=1 Tax=unclassified Streptomyces TaxID=2593676 RepID=UPI003412F0B2